MTQSISIDCAIENHTFLLKSPIRYARRAAGAHSLYVMSPFELTLKPKRSYP